MIDFTRAASAVRTEKAEIAQRVNHEVPKLAVVAPNAQPAVAVQL